MPTTHKSRRILDHADEASRSTYGSPQEVMALGFAQGAS